MREHNRFTLIKISHGKHEVPWFHESSIRVLSWLNWFQLWEYILKKWSFYFVKSLSEYIYSMITTPLNTKCVHFFTNTNADGTKFWVYPCSMPVLLTSLIILNVMINTYFQEQLWYDNRTSQREHSNDISLGVTTRQKYGNILMVCSQQRYRQCRHSCCWIMATSSYYAKKLR